MTPSVPAPSVPSHPPAELDSRPGRLPLLPLLVFLLVLPAFLGCNGGANSGGGGGGPTEPDPFVTLVPDVGALPSVSLRRGSGTEDANLELEIVVTELSNVATMDFVLRIPGELMRFEGAQAGPFLGLDASVVVTALSADQLQFLLTRAAPVGASGSDMALRLVFTGTAAGRGRIDFLGPEATTPGGIRIQGITWLGGNVEVSP